MSVFEFLKHRRILVLVGIYLLLLLASTFARWAREDLLFPEDKKSVVAAAVAGNILLENAPIRLAYREFTPPVETNQLPVILIHGSPGDSSNLVELAKTLSETRRVIVPDLPGFGDSTANIPDYSFRAHAFYIKQLADELKIEKFHVLGFSMGGGVVLNLEQIAPERIASIEMVSAVSVQEYELLGDIINRNGLQISSKYRKILAQQMRRKLAEVTSLIPKIRYRTDDELGRLTQTEQRTPVNGETLSTVIPKVSNSQCNFYGRIDERNYPSGKNLNLSPGLFLEGIINFV
jgi:pimeloyl-ACP methyl ester carboxylesterase